MPHSNSAESNLRYGAGLMRAVLGALIFALPLMMTAEMWELGITIDPFRLAVMLVVTFPMLVALSFYAGFEETFSLLDNVLDAFAAIAVSALTCVIVMWLFGELHLDAPMQEVVGKLIVLTFGASIGALLADKQLSGDQERADSSKRERGLAGRLFYMSIGAIFLSLNVAPTDEVEIIAASIGPHIVVTLACVSIATLAVLLIAADAQTRRATWLCKARRTFEGYALCILLSAFVLWCFDRLDGVALPEAVERLIVLGFPAALGAGAARLIFGGRASKDED